MSIVENKGSVEFFANAIRGAWTDSTRSILQVASIATSAYEQLEPSEYTQLATLSGLSLGTLSKFRMIHKRQSRFDRHVKELPAAWTLLYELTRLSDAQFKRLVDEKKLRPDLTIKEISFYAGMFAHEKVKQEGLRLFATIKISEGVSGATLSKLRLLIETKLKEILKGISSEIEFPESKSEARDRNRLAVASQLREILTKRLSSYKAARANLTERQYEVIENAAWQHQHKYQKKSYPYPSSDKKSIENAKTPIFSQRQI